ncbi:hypothetical protein BD779DRAFT_1673950 [Infundibulicybe gibba]|nr:hypothetical protein BD779DRAFT_1673950 [Infundibulicybe gibba]
MATLVSTVTGPLLIGYLLNACLFGVLTVQTYIYYSSFLEDRIHIKSLVCGVYLVEIAQTILTVCDAYVVFASGFGDLAVLTPIRTVWIYSLGLGCIVIFIVQVFYAHRISVLYNSWKFGLFIIIACPTLFTLSVTQLVAGEFGAAILKQQGNEDGLRNASGIPWMATMIFFSATFVCDISITICMTFWLLRARWGNKGYTRTNTITLSLLRVAVENGTVLAIVAIVSIIGLGFPNTGIDPALAITVPKWYSMTLLVSLNNRTNIQRQTEVNFTTPATGIRFQAATGTEANATQFEGPSETPINLPPSQYPAPPV